MSGWTIGLIILGGIAVTALAIYAARRSRSKYPPDDVYPTW